MRFRLATSGAQAMTAPFDQGFQALAQLPILQAQGAEQAQAADMKRQLTSAEISAHVADAALKQQKMNRLASAPDVLDTIIASNAGTDVPTLQAWRQQTLTGDKPTTSATGDPDTDAAIGITTQPGIDPAIAARLNTQYQRFAPALLNPEDYTVQGQADAAGKYQHQDAVDAMVRDPRVAALYGQAFAASDGKPLVQNIGNTGGGFNQYTGAGGTLDPALSALYGDTQQAGIRKDNAAAAASYASAAERKAQTRKVNQDIEQGARTGDIQLVPSQDGSLVAVNKRTLQVQPLVGADGRPVIRGGSGGGGKPLTGDQAKANLFGGRMMESDKILNELQAEGVLRPGNIKSIAEGVGSAIPLIGQQLGEGLGAATNWTQSPQQQQVEQAQRDFVNAVLRRESGAAISSSEFDSARKQYFPQPGDSPAVVEQKRRNRQIATTLMLKEVPEAQRYQLGQGLGTAASAQPKQTAAGPDYGFGQRADGTNKGTGFLGVLKRPDGAVSTEISIGVNLGGKEVEIPTLVPTLSQDEVNYLLGGGRPTPAIVNKAVSFARQRIAQGKSPFAQLGEGSQTGGATGSWGPPAAPAGWSIQRVN